MKKLLLLLTICSALIWSTDVHATHLMGADLTYTIVGPHQYIVTLNVFRDCNSAVVQPTSYRIFWQSVACSDTGGFQVNVANGYPKNVTDTCPSQHSTCDGGTVYGVQQWQYTSGVVNLPANCPDVVLSWASGNRNGVISNLTNPLNDALYISAEVNTSIIDASPQFLDPLTVDICLGQINYINQGGYDPNGDSLVYVLDTAQGTNGGGGGPAGYPYYPLDLGYTAGYTPTRPITSSTFNFDPSTGEITVLPTQTEYDVVKLVVYEYRNGVLIGHVERDMQVEVNICTDTLPTISGISGPGSTDTVFTITPCTSGCFTIYSSSADTSKSLTLTITGENAFPGATFTTTQGKDPSMTFCWAPTRADAGIFTFYVTVKDNNCPQPGQNTKGYKVIVPEIYPAGPDQTICQYTEVNARGTSTTPGVWVAMSVNPVPTVIADSTSPTTLITGFTAPGRYNYIWTSDTTCIDTMSVFVTAKPYAGPDQTTCQNGYTTMAGTGSGKWTAFPTNPAPTTFTDSISGTTTVYGFSATGVYTYVWTVNGCTDTMTITILPRPNAGPDQGICGGSGTITMAASGSGPWTADTSNPAVTVFADSTSPTTTVTGLNASGIYTYYWGTGCLDTVQIYINVQPFGGPDQTTCLNAPVTMGATGQGTWTAGQSNPAPVTIADPTSDSTLITGFSVVGKYVFIWTLGSCADTVSINVITPPIAGPDQILCGTNNVTMAGTGTGIWTAAGSNPAVTTFADSASPVTHITGLTVSGTYTFYWSNICGRDSVVITVSPKPDGGPSRTICQFDNITMAGTGNGTWTALPNNPASTTIVNPTSPTTLITGFNQGGTYLFVWSAGGCSDTVTVNVNFKPNAGANQTICQNTTAVLSAVTSIFISNPIWVASPSNPSVVTFTNNTLPNTSVTGFTQPGVYTLIWTGDGCGDTVQITVLPKPNGGPNQTICQFSTVTMAAADTAGTWTTLPGNPAPTVIVNPTSPTTLITGFTVPGVYNYIWSSHGCSNDTVSITVTSKPNAGPDQTICQYTTTSLAATGRGIWTVAPGNPSPVTFANDTLSNTSVSGFTQPGVYTLIWTVNGCSDSVLINVTPKPNAGPDQTTCQFSTATMAATGTGLWSALPNNPAITAIVSPTSPTTLITGFTVPGIYSYVWTSNGCTDTANVIVTPKPNGGPNQTICQYTTTVMAATGNGTWTATAGNPATVTFANASSPTTTVSGFTAAGTYGLIWTVNGCSDTVQVIVTPKPNAGPDQTTCQFSTATMAATGTGVWSALPNNPAVTVIVSPTSPTTEITGFTLPGTYGYVWTSNGCTDTADVIVTPKPNGGPNQTICQYTTTVMAATGNGTWTALSTNPAIVTFTNASSPTTTVSGFTASGTYGLIWTVNGCSDTVQVTVTPKPNAGPDQTTCQFSTANMAATGTGTWTALAGNPATTVIVTPTSPTTEITGFTLPGTYGYIWTSNGCTDTANVIVTPKPNGGPNQTICQNTSTVMAATGNGSWTASAGNPATVTFTNATSPTTTVSGFTTAGTYGLIWTVNGCSDTVQVTVTPKPNAGPDDTTCQFSTANLAATGTGVWSALTGNPATTTIVTPASPTTEVTGFTLPGTYGYIWTSNGCTDTAYVTVNPKPNGGPDQTLCLNNTATMAASGNGTWTASPGNPAVVTFTDPTTPNTTVSGFTIAGTYTLIWTVNGCSDSVLITVISKPNAGPDQTICQFSTATMAATGTGTWTALATNPVATTIITPTSPTTEITGFTVAGTYSYVWTVGGCTDTANVIVTPKPNAGPDQSFCIPGSTSLYATGGPGVWTALGTNPGSSTIVSPTSDTTVVDGITIGGYYSFIWTVNGCTDTMVVAAYPSDPAGPDQTICQYNTVTTAAFGVGTWIPLTNNPNPTIIANVNADTTTITDFNVPGVYGFIWSVALPCSDTLFVTVTAKPDAGPDQTTCQFSTATMAATGTGVWTAVPSNPATTVIVTPSSPTTEITGFTVAGTYSYVWTVNGCTDTANVIVTPKPNAGPDQTICQFSTTVMAATGTGTWTADAGNPATVTFTSATSPTTTVSGFTVAGTYALYWTNNGCPDTVLVTVTPKPNAGTDQTICQYSTTVLNATGSGTWTASAGNPATVTFANDTLDTTAVSGFTAAGTYSLYWTLNGCSDTVLINVTPKPNAGTDQTICQFSTTALAATGTGTWTADAGNPATVTFTNATSPTTTVSGFTIPGTYSLYWTNNGCPDTVLINVTPKPNAGPDQTICQNTTATTAATGSGTWTANPGNPATVTFTNATDSITTVSGFTVPGSYLLLWTLNGCSDTVKITVVQASTLHVNGGAICIGQNDTLIATVSVPGGTFLWTPGGATTDTIVVSPTSTTTYVVTYTIPVCGSYVDSATVVVHNVLSLTTENDTICFGSTATLSTTPSTPGGSYLWTPGGYTTDTIHVSPGNDTVYTVTYSLTGCLPVSVSDTVDVTIPPTLAVNNATVCLGDSATLTAVPSQPGGTYLWTPGGSTADSIRVAPGATASYNVSYGIPGSVCPPTTKTVTVTVTPQPTVRVDSAIICFGDTVTLIATPSIPGGTYVWSPVSGTGANVILSPGVTSTDTVIYTIAGCGSAMGIGLVTVNPNPEVAALTTVPITCFDSTNGIVIPTIAPPTGTYTYQWSNSETGAIDSNLAPGSYTLTVTDQNGCTATSSVPAIIGPAPAQAFVEIMPSDITVLQDSMVQLTSTFSYPLSTITGYSWTPAASLSCDACPAPIVNTSLATDTVIYDTLIIYYNNGCSAIAYDTIHILSGVAIGNAFTPNGDGKNDVFTIMADGVSTYHMSIFNRWGQLVFESYDKTIGWDGTFKGAQQPQGEYVYFVAITFLNGQSMNKTGTVTLLR